MVSGEIIVLRQGSIMVRTKLFVFSGQVVHLYEAGLSTTTFTFLIYASARNIEKTLAVTDVAVLVIVEHELGMPVKLITKMYPHAGD